MAVFQETLGWSGQAKVRPGINVSDRDDGWQRDYRIPDVAVFLKTGAAVNRSDFWLGGPDFIVEIISPNDRTRDKLPFYERIAVHEILVIDREPWQLEWSALRDGKLSLQIKARGAQAEIIQRLVLSLSFQLVPGSGRPAIEVRHNSTGRTWLV